MKKMLFLTLLAVALAAVNVPAATSAQTKQKPARQKKIGLAKARQIALQKAPGKVEAGEFEIENKKPVYSFDIRNQKGTITEVQVEAYTGEIVSVEEENRAAEAAEKKADAKEKHAKEKRAAKSAAKSKQ